MKTLPLLALATLFTLTTSSIADVAQGKKLFAERCASCHGIAGAGDGPVAASLPPEMKPRNLQTPDRKFATDDAKFLELLKKGGATVGLSPMMPGQPDLSDADLSSIIAFTNTLKK
jgi:high-affinity iron transporter